MELLLATGNQNKVKELQQLLAGTDWEIRSLKDFPGIEMPPEDANTFLGNATLKAKVGAVASGLWTLADDSGLEVDWLHGAPGVYSARFAGIEKNDEQNNKKLLSEMKDCPDEKRTARFVSVLALVSPTGKVYSAEGYCYGKIGRVEKGEFGFGYDPLFWVDGLGKTMSELTLAEKNQISHRSQALQKILPLLLEIIENERKFL